MVVQIDKASLASERPDPELHIHRTCAAPLAGLPKLNVTAVARQFTAVHRLSCSEVTPTVELMGIDIHCGVLCRA